MKIENAFKHCTYNASTLTTEWSKTNYSFCIEPEACDDRCDIEVGFFVEKIHLSYIKNIKLKKGSHEIYCNNTYLWLCSVDVFISTFHLYSTKTVILN